MAKTELVKLKSSAQQRTGCKLHRVAYFPLVAFIWGIAEVLVSAAILLSPAQLTAQSNPSAIIVGFLGGFVHVDDVRHGEVPMVEQLRATYGNRVHVKLFENRDKEQAHKSILKWLDSNNNGSLSGDEKHHMPIILFGNSWGASAL